MLQCCHPGLRVVAAAAIGLHATIAAAQRYVAPTQESITSRTVERDGASPSHVIYIDNRSTVSITVFSIHLSGCENVKQDCYPKRMNLRVPPGGSRMAIRVEPRSAIQGFSYSFGFSWNADSGATAALATLAAGGSASAQAQISEQRRADSLARATPGPRYNDLTRDDFAALAQRAARLRAVPDSLVLAPGERSSIDRIRLVLVDSQGVVLGQTRWMRWQSPTSGAVQFTPPAQLVARKPGRAVFEFALAEEAETLLGRSLGRVEVAMVSAYPVDPHAPSIAGIVVDADRQRPLACAVVALEDSAQNVVARERTSHLGTFVLQAPRPGTYRVRVDMRGWSSVFGPSEVAQADEVKQARFPVQFNEPLLVERRSEITDDEEPATPIGIAAPPVGVTRPTTSPRGAPATAAVRAATLGGTAANPILSIVGSAPQGTTWAQFVVDSVGRVDSTTALLAPTADSATVAAVNTVLPRLRFSPARRAGVPTCELMQLQVNLNGGAR